MGNVMETEDHHDNGMTNVPDFNYYPLCASITSLSDDLTEVEEEVITSTSNIKETTHTPEASNCETGFYFVFERNTYERAKEICNDLGYHLAILKTEQCFNLAKQYLSNRVPQVDVWIGARYKPRGGSHFVEWLDGQSTYINKWQVKYGKEYPLTARKHPFYKRYKKIAMSTTTMEFRNTHDKESLMALCQYPINA